MKRQLIAIGVFAGLACAGLYAQSMNMQANVPFPFTMGAVTMPAGEYSVNYGNQGFVTVREVGGSRHCAMVLTMAVSNAPAGQKGTGVLLFKRYDGGEFFLSSVWSPRSEVGRQLPEGARQKEYAARARASESTAIALNRK